MGQPQAAWLRGVPWSSRHVLEASVLFNLDFKKLSDLNVMAPKFDKFELTASGWVSESADATPNKFGPETADGRAHSRTSWHKMAALVLSFWLAPTFGLSEFACRAAQADAAHADAAHGRAFLGRCL